MENAQKIENNNDDMAQKPTNKQIEDLIQNAINKDYNKANAVFGDVMTIKLDDLLDQEKVKVADQIHNDVEEEEEDEPEEENENEDENEEKDEEDTEDADGEEEDELKDDNPDDEDIEGAAV